MTNDSFFYLFQSNVSRLHRPSLGPIDHFSSIPHLRQPPHPLHLTPSLFHPLAFLHSYDKSQRTNERTNANKITLCKKDRLPPELHMQIIREAIVRKCSALRDIPLRHVGILRSSIGELMKIERMGDSLLLFPSCSSRTRTPQHLGWMQSKKNN